MSFFEKYPEFIEVDSRKDRQWSPHTIETLDTRHEISLPSEIIQGRSVLDLGSCFGATGQWVLAHGALNYTGVEIQQEMVKKSREILGKYWNTDQFSIVESDVVSFLEQKIDQGFKYDVVVAVGVIYAFLDINKILKLITKVTKEVALIDSLYPFWMMNSEVSIIDVLRDQHINSEDFGVAFHGAGARPSPRALEILMETHNFISPEGLLFPRPLSDSTVHDPYNTLLDKPWTGGKKFKTPGRYMMRFVPVESTGTVELASRVISNDNTAKKDFPDPPEFSPIKSWVFDEGVAARFQEEADKHIPDYQRVIHACYVMVRSIYDPEITTTVNIIDVGSALGHTMEKFISGGFENVFGVDNSPAMISASRYPKRVFLNDRFPTDRKWDVVLANWTLHFISQRTQYLKDIYSGMNPGGMFFLTDKMSFTSPVQKLYFQFKRKQGVSDDEILEKNAALNGVLVTKPLQWYLETLKEIGFTEIQVINSRFMFNTIYARKL